MSWLALLMELKGNLSHPRHDWVDSSASLSSVLASNAGSESAPLPLPWTHRVMFEDTINSISEKSALSSVAGIDEEFELPATGDYSTFSSI